MNEVRCTINAVPHAGLIHLSQCIAPYAHINVYNILTNRVRALKSLLVGLVPRPFLPPVFKNKKKEEKKIRNGSRF